MAGDGEDFLSRWSRLKRADAAKPAAEAEHTNLPTPADAAAAIQPATAAPLPPIESLTLESDFRAFLQPGVSADLRKAALKKLFSDPHFHFDQMDKLDTYIDDYSIEAPIPEAMMKTLDHARRTLFEEEKKPEAMDASPEAPKPQEENADPKQDA